MRIHHPRHGLTVIVGLLVLTKTVGCADDGPEVVPVWGKITFAGREQPEVCRLTFLPQSTGAGIRPSSGEMADDGTYQPVPFRGINGLYPGEYLVRLSFYDLKPGGNRDVEGDWIPHEHESTETLVVESGAGSVTHDIVVPSVP